MIVNRFENDCSLTEATKAKIETLILKSDARTVKAVNSKIEIIKLGGTSTV